MMFLIKKLLAQNHTGLRKDPLGVSWWMTTTSSLKPSFQPTPQHFQVSDMIAALTPVTDDQKDIETNHTEFTIVAEPTCIGWVRKTQDMTNIYACLCGNKVSQTDIKGSKAARCTYPGCETQWVSDCATIYSDWLVVGTVPFGLSQLWLRALQLAVWGACKHQEGSAVEGLPF